MTQAPTSKASELTVDIFCAGSSPLLELRAFTGTMDATVTFELLLCFEHDLTLSRIGLATYLEL